jgi:N-acetyl-anhydromuramyl-L-alanine amidase AmpD
MEDKIPLKPEDIKYLIVHHTATARDTTTFESVRNYHINVRGFWEIGYHYFINGKGIIYPGRPENYVGAHCKTVSPSMNLMSLGICLAGDFTIETPSNEQLDSLKNLLKFLTEKYKIPVKNVWGHGEVPSVSTLCPGKNLLEWLKSWRNSQITSDSQDIISDLLEVKNKIEKIINKLQNK